MKLLACGGGVYNKCLMEVLKDKLGNLGVDIEILPDETKFKEAIVFAFLAVLRLRK
jgi:1,6-anhydro-N-acetylmuramate kinase